MKRITKKHLIILISIAIILIGSGIFMFYTTMKTGNDKSIKEDKKTKKKKDSNINNKETKNEKELDIKYIEDSYVDNISNAEIQERLKQKINFNQEVYSSLLKDSDFFHNEQNKQQILMDYIYNKYSVKSGTYIRFETLKDNVIELFGGTIDDSTLKSYTPSYKCRYIKYLNDQNSFRISDPGCGGTENPYYISVFNNLQSDNQYYYYHTALVVFKWNSTDAATTDGAYEVERNNLRLCKNTDCSNLVNTMTVSGESSWSEMLSQVEEHVKNNFINQFQNVTYVFDKNELTLKDIRLR